MIFEYCKYGVTFRLCSGMERVERNDEESVCMVCCCLGITSIEYER